MTIIYHITTLRDWAEAEIAGSYRPDSLLAEGFIHCSKADQVLAVANSLFQGQAGLVLLCVDSDRLTVGIRYESSGGGCELFPHIYGPLNLGAVVNVVALELGEHGSVALPACQLSCAAAELQRGRRLACFSTLS